MPRLFLPRLPLHLSFSFLLCSSSLLSSFSSSLLCTFFFHLFADYLPTLPYAPLLFYYFSFVLSIYYSLLTIFRLYYLTLANYLHVLRSVSLPTAVHLTTISPGSFFHLYSPPSCLVSTAHASILQPIFPIYFYSSFFVIHRLFPTAHTTQPIYLHQVSFLFTWLSNIFLTAHAVLSNCLRKEKKNTEIVDTTISFSLFSFLS